MFICRHTPARGKIITFLPSDYFLVLHFGIISFSSRIKYQDTRYKMKKMLKLRHREGKAMMKVFNFDWESSRDDVKILGDLFMLNFLF